jgi:hypothetical protein
MTDLITIGVDPHRKVFTASALDQPGRQIEHRHFPNSRSGHAAMFEWACRLGTVDRIGIEGASGLGRPLAEFLVSRRVDVRDVPPHKTSLRQRGRHEGKSDRLDAHRVAIETHTNDSLAHAFKQSQPTAPDQLRDQIALWHNARTSLRKIRVQLIGELDAMIHALPEELHDQLPDRTTVRAKINALADLDTSSVNNNPVHRLALDLIEHRRTMLREVLAQDKAAEVELAKLVSQSRSTLPTIPGIAAPRRRRDPARSRRRPTLHRGRVRPLHRNRTDTSQLRRSRRQTDPPPTEPWRKPSPERSHSPALP